MTRLKGKGPNGAALLLIILVLIVLFLLLYFFYLRPNGYLYLGF